MSLDVKIILAEHHYTLKFKIKKIKGIPVVKLSLDNGTKAVSKKLGISELLPHVLNSKFRIYIFICLDIQKFLFYSKIVFKKYVLNGQE